MKIASFNINDVNKRLGNLIRWLRAEKPDVVELQELKAADREFPKAAIEKAGYGAVWRGQKTWNGVAILARGCEPIGDSFAHRSYHALTKTIRRDGGRPAGAILGFANRLLQLYRTERPRAVLVGWDTLEAETYRHKAFPAYQSGRHFVDELVEQLELIPKFVAACGFANARRAGYEADDFLAAAAAAEERLGGTVLVASGDRDTFQLASEKTTILYPVKAGEMARIGPKEVRERYGVAPNQVPDFIALRGDPSDRLPGAPGIGAQGAAALIRQYGSLAALLKAGRFAKQAEDLKLYRSIATMDKKAS